MAVEPKCGQSAYDLNAEYDDSKCTGCFYYKHDRCSFMDSDTQLWIAECDGGFSDM